MICSWNVMQMKAYTLCFLKMYTLLWVWAMEHFKKYGRMLKNRVKSAILTVKMAFLLKNHQKNRNIQKFVLFLPKPLFVSIGLCVRRVLMIEWRRKVYFRTSCLFLNRNQNGHFLKNSVRVKKNTTFLKMNYFSSFKHQNTPNT